MFDDIKDEVTIPIPGTKYTFNMGDWAMAEGRQYNYTRVYIERTETATGSDGKPFEYPVFERTSFVERKERWDT